MDLRALFSYWLIPVFSGLVWFGMLLGMLLHWIINDDRRRFPSMRTGQSIAYISDVGAYTLKPLFIAGSSVTSVSFAVSFIVERWLRHRGRLLPNTSTTEKVVSALATVFAIVGAVGLILLTVFDTWRQSRLHRDFLLVFIIGYLLSALFICWEYWRLGSRYRQHPVLRISFGLKLSFFLIELVLVIIFAATSAAHRRDVAAVFEWLVAFILTFYIISFAIDLHPAVRTRRPENRHEKPRAGGDAATARDIGL